MIELNALYDVLLSTHTHPIRMSGKALTQRLAGKDNDMIDSYQRVVGDWYQVSYAGKVVFNVYAEDKHHALQVREEDLKQLGYTNPKMFDVEQLVEN